MTQRQSWVALHPRSPAHLSEFTVGPASADGSATSTRGTLTMFHNHIHRVRRCKAHVPDVSKT